MTLDPRRTAVLALHWQVNVIEPDGFFGGLLAAPVARSGVVSRAAAFHDAVRRVGVPVCFTRFTIPEGEGELVRNTAFMTAVADAQESFRPDAPGAALIEAMTVGAHDLVVDNQRLSGLAASPCRTGYGNWASTSCSSPASRRTSPWSRRHDTAPTWASPCT